MHNSITTTPLWQDMVKGRWYQTNAKPLRRARQSAKAMCVAFNSCPDSQQRAALLRTLLPNADAIISPSFFCDYGMNIFADDTVRIDKNVVILDAAPVTIGTSVVIGQGCVIATLQHHNDPTQRLRGMQQAFPICIGNNARLGQNVTLLPGAIVPDNAVVPDYHVVSSAQ
ncbi:sugar O-acetyltransferase [Salinimonas sp. HHU 13199]|uniref:Sugar O-acetyltransferase n=1 Tax=Salinimonas profundi TaxID=2729140 RepID=A0ABR8LLE5_9ALTE|nr:maltose acetyltransferase domain-containing protein [Salinimonas profundi]MBD3585147.1 sugar O-acetyltransferase [Salinimonas profundi]